MPGTGFMPDRVQAPHLEHLSSPLSKFAHTAQPGIIRIVLAASPPSPKGANSTNIRMPRTEWDISFWKPPGMLSC